MAAMSYLQKHPRSGVYRVRRPIPPAARDAFNGKKEYLQSLNTKDLAEAKRAAFPVLAELQSKIDRALAGAVLWQTHDMRHYLYQLAEWSGWQGRRFDQVAVYESRDEWHRDLAEFAGKKLPGITAMDLEDFRRFVETEIDDLLPKTAKPAEPAPEPTAKRIRLTGLEARILQDNDYEARSAMDTRNIFGFLRELRGDCYANEVKPAHIRELRDLLLKYPVGGRTDATVKMGLRKVAEKSWPRTMAPKTVKKLISFLSTGFKLAVSEGWAEVNPCQGLTYPKRTETSRKVEVVDWRPEDLRKLFESPLYRGCRSESRLSVPGNVHVRDHHFWLPLLGMFTGARLTELCQLETTDVRQDHGVWYLHLTTRTDDDDLSEEKSLKTKDSHREVPVHQTLIDLGFIKFVQEQKRPGGLLFQHNHASVKAFSRKMSDWFGGYLDRIGLTHPGLRFHSFRHSFKTACRLANIPAEVHDGLTGHVPQTVGGQYGQQKRLVAYLKEQIDLIRYDVDLSGLARASVKSVV